MLKIIVVDDSKEDLLLVSRILEQCKLLNPILCVSTVSACIEELEKAQSEQNQPSLILLDLIMGSQSGLDVLRYVQSVPYRNFCLVVMLSGLREMKVVNEGYQLGAKTFLLKPLAVRDIAELVNSLPEIGIEELEAGYILHWKQRIETDGDSRFKTSRIKTLAA